MEEHQDLYPLAAVYLFEKAADGSLACERIFSLSEQKYAKLAATTADIFMFLCEVEE